MSGPKLAALILVITSFIAAAWIVGCSGPTVIDEIDQCQNNEAPVIGRLQYIVNDELTEAPQIKEGDSFVLWLQYEDDDCNLGGGNVWWSLDGGQFSIVDALSKKLPCDGTGNNDGFLYDVELAGLSDGEHEFRIGVTDICDEPSNSIVGTFSVQGDIPIDDDDDDDDDTTPTDDDDDDFDDGFLENGDFEDGNDHWTENPSGIVKNKVALPYYPPPLPSGNYAALLTENLADTVTLKQQAVVPSNTATITVSFKMLLISGEANTGDDTFYVALADSNDNVLTTFFTFTDQDQWNGWKTRTAQFDVNGSQDLKPVKIVFRLNADGDNNITYVIIDNVSLTRD
ncbi:MAG TPA: hypothetical protein PKW95_11050 [bacterium]|nr:hypothetical protein [bacterium]